MFSVGFLAVPLVLLQFHQLFMLFIGFLELNLTVAVAAAIALVALLVLLALVAVAAAIAIVDLRHDGREDLDVM